MMRLSIVLSGAAIALAAWRRGVTGAGADGGDRNSCRFDTVCEHEHTPVVRASPTS